MDTPSILPTACENDLRNLLLALTLKTLRDIATDDQKVDRLMAMIEKERAVEIEHLKAHAAQLGSIAGTTEPTTKE